MVNKQKLWFLTLFSLILILSVYYITMPSELLTTNKNTSKTTTVKNVNISIDETDYISALQVEKDEERSALAAEYNEILTNANASTEEKNNAYEGLKKIDEIKAMEERIVKKIKEKNNLTSFVKIDGNDISITINKKEHDYSLANDIMRLVQEEFDNKMYISVKFKN